jgi:hypothetical protein
MSTSHLKECINKENMFDFLKDVVETVPDMQNEDSDAPGSSSSTLEDANKKLARKRSNPSTKTSKKRNKVAKTSSDMDSESQSNECDSDESAAGNGYQLHSSAAAPSIPVDLSSQSDKSRKESGFHIPLDQLLSEEKPKQMIPTTTCRSTDGNIKSPYPGGDVKYPPGQTDVNKNDKFDKTYIVSPSMHRDASTCSRRISSDRLDVNVYHNDSHASLGSLNSSIKDHQKSYKSSDPALASVNCSNDGEKLLSPQPPMFSLSSLTQDTERLNTMYQLPSISRPFVTDEDDDYDT